jgi:nicotinamide-nucleotide amidase
MTAGTENLARAVLRACEERGLMLVTAESCTGGMVAAALTDIAGSSSVVDRGFVTYSNAAKTEMLGVKPSTLADHGAVSQETAVEMAEGALARSRADIAVSITGIAGPGGGSAEKPVGLVWFAVAMRGKAPLARKHLFGDIGRAAVRQESVVTALHMLLEMLEAERS